MKTKYIIQCVFGLFVLILNNGCATHALWHNDNLEAWNEPASNVNLHVFRATPQNDLLVVYDEYSERSGATHTRAYWLNENQKTVGKGGAPHFVGTNSIFNLAAIPVLLETTQTVDLPPPPYALLQTNQQSFTFFSESGQSGPHDLPVYNDQKGKMEKFALTPLATAADITIVGGVFGYFFLEGVASSGASYSWKP